MFILGKPLIEKVENEYENENEDNIIIVNDIEADNWEYAPNYVDVNLVSCVL